MADAANTFVIEPNADDDMAVCSCCAGAPGLRGTVLQNGAPVAIYFADPAGMPNYPMLRLGLVTGPWQDSTQPAERTAAAFTCRPAQTADSAPEILPADPFLQGFQEFPFLGVPIDARNMVADGRLNHWLELARAIIASDPRLIEIQSFGPSAKKMIPYHNRRVAPGPAKGQS